ncbi:hypothetical protein cypCar_00035205 [Cyprinus carpio]|nr:hypothetical protein cypCar_00035205 [Cyprinus carpio]
MKVNSRDESLNTSGECDLLTGNSPSGQSKKNMKQRFLKLLPCCHVDSTPTVRKGNIEEDFELATVCCRPDSLEKMLEQTKFTKTELQILYRSFKNECPTGLVNEETFKLIYSNFFPQGDSSAYAHFLFEAFDKHKNGAVNFEDFVVGLSIILRGTVTDRLCWAFSLYDLNKDGCVTKEKMDRNNDGVVTMEEFLESCQKGHGVQCCDQESETGGSGDGLQPIIFNPDFFVEKLCHERPEAFTELVLSNITRLIDLPGAEFSQLLGDEEPKTPNGTTAGGFFCSFNFLKRKACSGH